MEVDLERPNIILETDGVDSPVAACFCLAGIDDVGHPIGFVDKKALVAWVHNLKGDRFHSGAHDGWIVDEQRQVQSSRQRIAYLYEIRRWLLDCCICEVLWGVYLVSRRVGIRTLGRDFCSVLRIVARGGHYIPRERAKGGTARSNKCHNGEADRLHRSWHHNPRSSILRHILLVRKRILEENGDGYQNPGSSLLPSLDSSRYRSRKIWPNPYNCMQDRDIRLSAHPMFM